MPFRYPFQKRANNNDNTAAVNLFRRQEEGKQDEIKEIILMIRSTADLKMIYTALSHSFRSGFFTRPEYEKYVHDALWHTFKIIANVVNSSSQEELEVVLQMKINFGHVLDKAVDDNIINTHERTQLQSFVIERIADEIVIVWQQIDQLNIRIDRIESCLENIRDHLNRDQKIKSVCGFAAVFLNLFTLGAGGSALSSVVEGMFGQIVDFGDLDHVKGIVGDTKLNFDSLFMSGFKKVEEYSTSQLQNNVALSLNNAFGTEMNSGDTEAKNETEENEAMAIYKVGAVLQVALIEVVLARLEKQKDLSKKNEKDCFDDILAIVHEHTHIVSIQEKGIEAIETSMRNHEMCDRDQQQSGLDAFMRCISTRHLSASADSLGHSITFVENNHLLERNTKFIDKKCKEGIEAIVTAMAKHPERLPVQEKGCKAFLILASVNSENKTAINKFMGVDAIVAAMTEHRFQLSVQKYGCWALMILATDNTENRITINNCKGIDAIIVAMTSHPKDPIVQDNGCGALMMLTDDNPENKIAIRECKGIEAVVVAMKNHIENVDIQAYGCAVLTGLADDNSENKDVINQCKGIEAIVTAMKNHQKSSDVQKSGCIALLILANGHHQNKMDISHLKGIEAIVTAMTNYPKNSFVSIQEFGCWALMLLANEVPQNKIAINNYSGIEAIINAMTNHRRNPNIQKYGCGALMTLADNNAENRIHINNCNGIEAIVAAMTKHHGNTSVQEYGCKACLILAETDIENRIAINNCNGIEAIVTAMTAHQAKADIQVYGCDTFWKLAIDNEKHRIGINRSKGIDAIVTAMTNHQSNASIQRSGCRALMNLINNSDNRNAICQCKGIDALITAITNHQNDDTIQGCGCAVLMILAHDNPKNKILIKNCKGIEAIISLISQW